MERSRRLLITLVLALGLTVLDPPLLDLVRYPVALVASWPVRALAGLLGDPVPDPAALRLEAEGLRAPLDQVLPRPPGFPVFQVDEEERWLFIVGGWKQGLVRGDRVLAGDVLVGFVDRVEEGLARVLVLGNRHSHVSGLVLEAADGSAADQARAELLLSGSGGASLYARQGSRIEAELEGLEVMAPDLDSGRPRWRIGRIERDPRLDLEVVRCAVELETLDEVTVLGRDPGGELRGGRDLEAQVLAEGGGGTEPRSWLIGRGSADGLKVGCFISSAGRLVGRVTRTGPFSARVVDLAVSMPLLPALVVDGETIGHRLWSPADPAGAPCYSRGRDRDASLPRGLYLPPGGRLERRPQVGELVTVHVSGDPAVLLRLGGRP